MVDKKPLHKRQDKDTGLNAIWGAFPDLDPDEVMKYRNEERDNLLDAERYRKIKRLAKEYRCVCVVTIEDDCRIETGFFKNDMSRARTKSGYFARFDTLDQAVDEVVE